MVRLWNSPWSTAFGLITLFIYPGEGVLHCFQELELATDPDHKLIYPFSLEETPMCPEDLNTDFILYTGQNSPEVTITLGNSEENLNFTWLEKKNETKIFIHGWLQRPSVNSIEKIRKSLLNNQEANVIMVDWSHGSRAMSGYNQAVVNTWVVGLQVAKFVNALTENNEEKAAHVHIIGFSLGAHIAGFAGERIPGLGRITGLDPARQEFEGSQPSQRLDPNDAVFVDVIHTDTTDTHLPIHGYGYKEPCGDVDFYPNGDYAIYFHEDVKFYPDDDVDFYLNGGPGDSQPGCKLFILQIPACAHLRALEYFLESTEYYQDCVFHSQLCDSYQNYLQDNCTTNEGEKIFANMGLGAINVAEKIKQFEWPRKFYLSTNYRPKFSIIDDCTA